MNFLRIREQYLQTLQERVDEIIPKIDKFLVENYNNLIRTAKIEIDGNEVDVPNTWDEDPWRDDIIQEIISHYSDDWNIHWAREVEGTDKRNRFVLVYKYDIRKILEGIARPKEVKQHVVMFDERPNRCDLIDL